MHRVGGSARRLLGVPVCLIVYRREHWVCSMCGCIEGMR